MSNRTLQIISAVLMIFANVFGIILFAYMFFYGIQGWREIMVIVQHDLNARMFWLMVLVGCLSGILFFLEKFINGILVGVNESKRRPNGKKRTDRVRQ